MYTCAFFFRDCIEYVSIIFFLEYCIEYVSIHGIYMYTHCIQCARIEPDIILGVWTFMHAPPAKGRTYVGAKISGDVFAQANMYICSCRGKNMRS